MAAVGRIVGEEIIESIHADVCGLYFRSVLLPRAGTSIEQHVHDHLHANYCAAGSAQFWEDGLHVCDVRAGDAIEVRAGKLHTFVSLEDNTRLTCVHSLASAEALKEKGI